MKSEIILKCAALTEPTEVRIVAQKTVVAGKKNNNAEPNVAKNEMVEVQTQSFDNPKYTINNVYIINSDTLDTTISYEQFLELLQLEYDGTEDTEIILNVNYPNYDRTELIALPSLTGSTDIKVVLDTYSVSLDAGDSKDAYLPIGSLVFTETN